MDDVFICPIKIFDRHGTGYSEDLKLTLEKLLDSAIDIICVPVSFDSVDNKIIFEIDSILKKLFYKNKIIFASASNNVNRELSSLPANSKYVIGTKCCDKILNDEDYFFNSNNSIQYEGCGRPVFTRSINNNIELFGNNSRTCILAMIHYINNYRNIRNRDYDDVFSKEGNIKSKKYVDSIKSVSYNKTIDIKGNIFRILNDFSTVNEPKLLEKYGLLNNLTGIGKHNILYLVRALEKKFGVVLTDLYYDEFNDLNKLCKIICEKCLRGDSK